MLGRQAEAQKIIDYEETQSSEIYTSILTVNEFIQKTYNDHHASPDIDEIVKRVIRSIRNIAKIEGFNGDTAKEAARLMSVWGRFRQLELKLNPRDKKFRWDSIHLATANLIGVDRIYAWDNPWSDFPKNEFRKSNKSFLPQKRRNLKFRRVCLMMEMVKNKLILN